MVTAPSSPVLGLPGRTAVVFALLFLVALGVYVALWAGSMVLDGDSPQYMEVARDLADGRLDTLHDRTIGYPVVLALTGAVEHPTRALLVVSLLLHFASVWLLAVVLAAAGVARRWLLVFGVLLLLPPFVEPAGWVMTENLAQFTLVAGFAALVLGFSPPRTWLLVASGLLFGYAALTRPVYLALPLALAACLGLAPVALRWARFASRDAVRAGTAVVAGSLLVLGAMASFNHAKFGFLGVSPLTGFHLCTKTMAFVERLPDEYAPVREIFVRERNAELVKRGGVHTGTQAVWSIRDELSHATGLSMTDLSAYLVRMNLRLIARAPVEYLQEVARSAAVYWFPAPSGLASMRSSLLRWAWGLLHLAVIGFFFLQIVVLVGVTTFEASRRIGAGTREPRAPWVRATAAQALAYLLAGGIVFYTMALTCLVDIGEPRQRRPTDAIIVFMCVLGAHVWWRTVGERGEKP